MFQTQTSEQINKSKKTLLQLKPDINITVLYTIGRHQHFRLAEKRHIIQAYIHSVEEAYPINGFFFDVSQSALIYCGTLKGIEAEATILNYILTGLA